MCLKKFKDILPIPNYFGLCNFLVGEKREEYFKSLQNVDLTCMHLNYPQTKSQKICIAYFI